MKKVLAMILAGGRVDDLKVLTLNRPKSTLPFGGMYRVIDFPLSNLMHSGIEKVGVLSQYHSASLVRHIGIGSSWDMIGRDRGAMVLPPFKSDTNSDWYKGTADAVFQNLDFIDQFNPELILILSGDHIYRMDYGELIDYHITKRADVTAVFKQVPRETAHRFGIATINNDDHVIGGRILEYQEKPKQPRATWASLTIYLFNANILKQILQWLIHHPCESYEFGHDILPYMVTSYRTFGFKFYDYWAYSRTIEEYWQANMDLVGERPLIDLENWEVRTNLDHRQLRDRAPTIITETAEIKDSRIHSGCVIEGSVSQSIIFPGVIIETGAKVTQSVIMFDTIIKRNTVINKSILDTDIVIGENCSIGKMELTRERKSRKSIPSNGITVIGQGTIVASDMVIGENCLINPHKNLEQLEDKIIPSGKIIL